MPQLVKKWISTIKSTSMGSFEFQSCWPIGFTCFCERKSTERKGGKLGWLMATPNPISTIPQRSKRAPKNPDIAWPHPLKIFVKTVMVSQNQRGWSLYQAANAGVKGLNVLVPVSIPSGCHSKLCWNTSSRALQWSTSGETSGSFFSSWWKVVCLLSNLVNHGNPRFRRFHELP